jgi:hypothetical protein
MHQYKTRDKFSQIQTQFAGSRSHRKMRNVTVLYMIKRRGISYMI